MQIKDKTTGLTTFLTLALSALAGCSHGPVTQEFPDTASATEEVQSLDRDVKAAREQQANVLAPKSFEQAQNSLDRAKKGQEKQKDAKDILHQVAEGRAYLNQANAFSQTARTNMDEVATARQQSITAGASTFFKKDFRSADDQLTEVTGDLENNNTGSVQAKRAQLQATYLELELRAIKQTNLGEARDTVAQAIKEGAKDYAPRSLAQTDKLILDNDAFIVANRHETEQLKTRSAVTKENADHLLKITRAAKSDKKTSPEELALRNESEQNLVTAKQKQVDAKQRQVVDTQNQLSDSKEALQDKKAELSEEQGTVAELAAQRSKLVSDREFEKRYDQARAQFTDSEAEVYKQGNNLLIRLKGLEFPVSKSELRSGNFPLLAKVQAVIKDFGKSTVLIEGHTDSDGAKARNEKLSTARAQAVSAYLVSNNTVDQANIKAIGYGDQKPLASNKTAAGKAQNRRVDVIITPDKGETSGI